MKKNLTYITVLSILIGCGNNGNSIPDTEMVISEKYTVFSGDKIVKNSDDAILRIYHVGGSSESTVTLLMGKATLQH